MSKKRYRPEEMIGWQQGESVCAGFAPCCHFLSTWQRAQPAENAGMTGGYGRAPIRSEVKRSIQLS